jgi:hypothetical protein
MIRVLPESAGNVLGVQASGKMSDSDYKDFWIPKLKDIIETHGSVRALLYMDETFDGWGLGAMWEDAKFGQRQADDFEKIAVVGGPDWMRNTVGMFANFMKGEIKCFTGDKLDEAWSWIK